MMNDYPFDKYIKDSLESYKTPVPVGLWEKIALETGKKKPKPFWATPYFKIGVPAVVAAALLVAYLFYPRNSIYTVIDNNSSKKATIITTKAAFVNKDNIKTAYTKHANTLNIDESVSKSASPITFVESNNGKKAATTKASRIAVATSNSINKNDASTATIANKPTSNYVPPSKNAIETSIKNTSTNNASHVSSITQKLDNIPASKNDKQAKASPVFPIAISTDKNTSKIKKQGNNDGIAIENNNVTLVEKPFEKANAVLIATHQLDYLLINKRLASLKMDEDNNPTISLKPRRVPGNWYVGAYISPDYNTKTATTNGLSHRFLQTRDSSQKLLKTGTTLGIGLTRRFSDHFLIKTGFQYKQVNERFIYTKQGDIKDITVVNTRAYMGDLGETLYKNDTSILHQIGYTIKTNNNTYKSFEVPVLASYEAGNAKWHFALNGGAIINLLSVYEGQTYDSSLAVVPLNAAKTNGFFKSTTNISLYAGISLLRNIGNNMELFAEPYYRQSLSSTSISAIGYNQRFNSMGISFGIRYKLYTISNK
ncbi:hypothetical protein [Parasediminibacterium sp. JCM 36343]|uniref:hypothetical protein n=1 Tax=Parasediminibacterium sp. JCM 36343 TaxID=3374279 RepID=UPI00397AFF06